MVTPTTLEIKRGGYAVAFIYAAVYLVVALIAKQLQISNSYFFMASAVVTLMVGYYLAPVVFSKPVIRAGTQSIHTRKLGEVPWNQIKNISIIREPRFSSKGFNKVDIYLCIETSNSRTDQFNALFLANGEASANELVTYYKKVAHPEKFGKL